MKENSGEDDTSGCFSCGRLYQKRNVIFLLSTIFIDSLLTWKVYLYSDQILFFVFGLAFTIIPLTVLSIGLCCQNSTHQHRVQRIPILNILWILSLNNNKTKIMQIAVTVLMSFPQYLLNDTFILSQRHLTLYNKLQLFFSYIVLMFCPLLNFCMIMYEEMKREQSKRNDPASDSDHNQHYSQYKMLCRVMITSLLVLPLIFIELIHFFPVLLEYCFYSHISATDLLANLVLFNLLKFPICSLTVWVAIYHHAHDKIRKKRRVSSIRNWCGWYTWMICGLCLWTLITPLIVAIAVIKSERNVHKSMLCLAIVYILLSYGGMCAWLALSVSPTFYGLGFYTKCCMVIIAVLIVIDVVVLFVVDWYEHHRTGSKFIALPYDITDDDDEEDIDNDGRKQEKLQFIQT